MSCGSSNINETFIVTSIPDEISGCTGIYTNEIISCSGDTNISLGFGFVTIGPNLSVSNAISGDTFSGNTYYSGGTNLLDIFASNDKFISGGTFNHSGETLTLTRNDGVNLVITGFTDFYTTGGTLFGSTIYFDRTDSLSAYTIDLSSIVLTDTYVTGGTFNTTSRVLTLTKNDNINISISGFSDTYTTGATYSNGYVYFDRNDALSAYTLNLTPLTGDANTYVTGGTLSGNTLIIERNDNVNINIDLIDLRFSGGTGHCITDFYVTNIHGCSPITIYDPLILLSGLTINAPNQDNLTTQILSRDSGSGEIKYRDVQSIISAATSQDIYVTGLTFSSNNLTITRNDDVSFSVLLDSFSGLTISGNTVLTNLSANTISATSISATTYYGLPTDVFVTGGTYSNGETIFTNNTGGTFNITGFFTGSTDIFVTGGTYSNGTATFTNNTGGTFNVIGFNTTVDTYVSGFTYSNNLFTLSNSTGGTLSALINTVTGLTVNGTLNTTSISATTYLNLPVSATTDTYVTGFTYSNNVATIKQQSQNDLSIFIDSMSGLTVNGNLTTNTISATTYLNLPTDVRVTGGTYSNGTTTFTNNTGGTFSVSGFLTGSTDVFVTGGTYSNSTGNALFTNNTGGTFNVGGFFKPSDDVFTTGLTINNSTYDLTITRNDGVMFTTNLGILTSDVNITGGTYNQNTGVVAFTNNTGGTFSVSGFTTGLTDTTVASFSYNNANTFNITDSTGGTFNAYINVVTGLTVNGIVSATTVSATTYYGDGSNLTGISTQDTFVTGGTYSNGTAIFTNNTGGTFNVTGLYTGSTDNDRFTTGFTNSNNILTISDNSGGTYSTLFNTVTGFTSTGLISSDTISATTISVANYIDFNTGTTDPIAVAGRVYYDSSEHALSYYPDTPNMDVTINIGQESVTRVHNATGNLILNGSACNINGFAGGHPSVILADASGSGSTSIVSGIATHDIADGTDGFITNFGIVRDLSITGVSSGSIIYLSDTNPGAFVYDTTTLEFSSRRNKIGRVILTGVTGATIYVSIENENTSFTLSDFEKNITLGNAISTGTYEYTGATTASTTTINVSPLRGWVVNNTYEYATLPEVIDINYTGETGVTITNIASADSTYLLINSGATLVQQVTPPTPQERRENIFIGKVVHVNRTSILTILQVVDYDISPVSQLRDLWTPIKLINQGIVVSPNGTNLNFNTSAGKLWGNGINWATNQLNPNSVSFVGNSPVTFQYRTQTGGTPTNTTDIIPGSYDVGGTVTSIGGGSNSSTNQRVYLYPTGNIRIQYGQTVYSSLSAAVAGSQTESFVENAQNQENAILIGIISVIKTATNLSDTAQAVFNFVSKFGEALGGTGGLSTTTLQQAYDNSSNPEIITNSILDGVQFQGGTGSDLDANIIIENNAGSATGRWNADGGLSATTITATTIYATTYQNLPTDVVVTGATYSDNTFTYTNNTGGTFNVLFNTMSGLTVNGDLDVFGNSSFSGSGTDVVTIIGSGSGSTNPIFAIHGDSGELFTVTDSTDGILFSVNNDVSTPILQVNSDNTVLIGEYNAPGLYTSTIVTATTGTTNIYTLQMSAYTGAFFDYIINDGLNLRAGSITSIFSGTNITYNEVSTTDIGDTSDLTFDMVLSGDTSILTTSATTNSWVIKTLIRSI